MKMKPADVDDIIASLSRIRVVGDKPDSIAFLIPEGVRTRDYFRRLKKKLK